MSRSSPPPRSRDLAALIGRTSHELGDDLTLAERHIFESMARDLRAKKQVPPDLVVQGLRALASRAASTDRSESVVSLFSAAAALRPQDPTFPYDIGNHLARLGRTDDAIAAYGRALAIDDGMAFAWYNRGRLRFDAGLVEEAIDDFANAAQVGIELEGFHYSVSRRIIRARGFTAFLMWVVESPFRKDQVLEFLRALSKCIQEAMAYGGWFLTFPVSVESDPIHSLYVLASLADILRESPFESKGYINTGRTEAGYTAKFLDESEVAEAFWYRPAEWQAGEHQPDRVAHLDWLQALIDSSGDAAAAGCAAHYAMGAILLSTLMGGRIDWPTPVWRLSVPCDIASGRAVPRAAEVAAVAKWVADRSDLTVDALAIEHFRLAAEGMLSILADRNQPEPSVMVLIGHDDQPMMKDGEWVTNSPARRMAYDLWSWAEPFFREWITAAALAHDLEQHLSASSRGRQLNAFVATELWAGLTPEVWRACRQDILTFYEPRVSLADVRRVLGPTGLLVDYYVHEVVEDTIVRLALGSDAANVREFAVDTLAGDLRTLIAAHHPGEMPPDGLGGRVDELLMGELGRHLTDAQCLVISPFGYLRNVPFHALSSVQDAVDRGRLTRIAYLPSSAIVHADRRGDLPQRCLFVGIDPSGDIDVDEEIRIVRATFPSVTVLRDDDATVEEVVRRLREHDVVHFACHGDVDGDIGAGFLALADGRLYPWHVLQIPGVPPSVVLNACLTSTTETFEPTSDEAVGLHTAFLAAGATRVVGGLWEINEWSARHFAEAFYDHWVGMQRPAAEAVVRAQKVLRSKTADPFLWAPHALFGHWS